MDYEKKYKETIDKLRKLHTDWSSTQNRAAKEIELAFPELGESDDEKIRKGLIEHLKELKEQSVEGSHLKRPEHYDAWIAWLEKQDEQKHINECNTHEPTIDEARKWNEAYEKGYSLGYENGRNEQKPVEWSEEDENMWLQIINELEAIKSNSSTIFEKNIAQDKIDWLKSIKRQLH